MSHARRRRARRSLASTSRSRSRRSSFRTRSPGSTCSRSRRPDPARRSPSRVPIVERTVADRRRARPRSCSSRRASSRRRSPPSSSRLRPPRSLTRRRRLRRRAARAPRRSAPRGAHILVATPGRLEDLAERRLVDLSQRPHARPRRGRPDARHGLPAAGRPHRPPAAAEPPDDVLLGHARRPRSASWHAPTRNSPSRFEAELADRASPARSSTASSR